MKNHTCTLFMKKSEGHSKPGYRTNAACCMSAILLFITLFSNIEVYGQDADRTHQADENGLLPALTELEEGWQTLLPGGNTVCAHGSPFAFYSHMGDPNRLVIYLYGGGGCWDAETCTPGTGLYVEEIAEWHNPAYLDGMMKPGHPENPFDGFTKLAIPVCTGDVYIGDRDVEYHPEEGEPFTIRHRGMYNTMAAINWLESSLSDFDEIIVAGSSAGAVAVPFYANLMATRYSNARVTSFGDDASSYGTEFMPLANLVVWGVPETLQRYPGWEDFDFEHFGMEVFYSHAARGLDNLRMFLIDHAKDSMQKIYLVAGGTENPDLKAIMQQMQSTITSDLPNSRSFLIGGKSHTSLQLPRFYQYQENGVSLRDWVAAAAAWEDVPNVQCESPCQRPGIVYTPEDVTFIDNALAFFDSPERWSDTDELQPCPNDESTPRSIRCGVGYAAAITGRPAMEFASTQTLMHKMAERLGRTDFNMITVDFNNSPDTHFEDMRSLLSDLRDEVMANLAE